MYKVEDIANYTVTFCNKNKIYIDFYKLIKILYFLQAGFLIELNKPLFKDEIQAKRLGSYIPIEAYGFDKKFKQIDIVENKEIQFEENDLALLNHILNHFARMGTDKLSHIIRKQDCWQNAYINNEPIHNEDIIKYFNKVNVIKNNAII